jgi:Na+-transporting NADH:ubiquinone oxidoreductase subunit C
MNVNGRVYTIVFTFLYTFVFIFLLTFVYLIAKDKIEVSQSLFRKKALLSSFGITYNSSEEAESKYTSMVSSSEIGEYEIFTADVNGEKRYLLIFTGQGLWGTIQGALSVNEDVTVISGLDIISHSETPGLGGRIEEEWFLRQFKNEKISNGRISFTKGEGNYTPDDSNIDAVTGATRTSDALEEMVNDTLKTFNQLKNEGAL